MILERLQYETEVLEQEMCIKKYRVIFTLQDSKTLIQWSRRFNFQDTKPETFPQSRPLFEWIPDNHISFCI